MKRYLQQVIIVITISVLSGGIVIAAGGYNFTVLTSGFLRKTALHHDDGPAMHGGHWFYYGYGWSGENQEWGYGYGYNGSYALMHGPEVVDYGFEGEEGPATIDKVAVTQTVGQITYSTNYLAQIQRGYSLSTPVTLGNIIEFSGEAEFNSGERTWNIEGLTCDTTYYYVISAFDAADNEWTVHGDFTTDSCNTKHRDVVGVLPGVLPAGSGNGNHTNHNPRGLRLPSITLALGSVGADVKDLQILLNFFGTFLASDGAGAPYQETETFGQKTFNALKKFQRTFDLKKVDGIYGPETYGVMESFLK